MSEWAKWRERGRSASSRARGGVETTGRQNVKLICHYVTSWNPPRMSPAGCRRVGALRRKGTIFALCQVGGDHAESSCVIAVSAKATQNQCSSAGRNIEQGASCIFFPPFCGHTKKHTQWYFPTVHEQVLIIMMMMNQLPSLCQWCSLKVHVCHRLSNGNIWMAFSHIDIVLPNRQQQNHNRGGRWNRSTVSVSDMHTYHKQYNLNK